MGGQLSSAIQIRKVLRCFLGIIMSSSKPVGDQPGNCKSKRRCFPQRAPTTLQYASPTAVYVASVTIGADVDLSLTVPTKEHPVVFGNVHFFQAGMVDDSLTLMHTTSD